jgi:hypothetical protein
VADVLVDHVVLAYEAIDRMYLNVYVPHLQAVGGILGHLRVHRGQRFASTTAVAPMTDVLIRYIVRYIENGEAWRAPCSDHPPTRGYCGEHRRSIPLAEVAAFTIAPRKLWSTLVASPALREWQPIRRTRPLILINHRAHDSITMENTGGMP